MRRQLIIGGLVLASIGATAACQPTPVIGQPGYCGQTQDGKAVVAMHNDTAACTALPGQIRLAVDEMCGPIMPGSFAVDDCWRGAVAGIGPGYFRLGTLQQPGNVPDRFVASDYTAVP